MMVRTKSLHDKAVAMRRRGRSYSEILSLVPVAKSTLSLWLRNVGLSSKQKQRITEKKRQAMKRGWETIRTRKLARVRVIKSAATSEVRTLISDPFWLTGVILYWGEGNKEKPWSSSAKVAFSNMDLSMHKLFLAWIKKYLKVAGKDIRYEVYIHEDSDTYSIARYWRTNLNIQKDQLRIYYKHNVLNTKRKNIGRDYKGVLRICVIKSSTLNRRIAGWIEGVVQYAHQWGIV